MNIEKALRNIQYKHALELIDEDADWLVDYLKKYSDRSIEDTLVFLGYKKYENNENLFYDFFSKPEDNVELKMVFDLSDLDNNNITYYVLEDGEIPEGFTDTKVTLEEGIILKATDALNKAKGALKSFGAKVGQAAKGAGQAASEIADASVLGQLAKGVIGGVKQTAGGVKQLASEIKQYVKSESALPEGTYLINFYDSSRKNPNEIISTKEFNVTKNQPIPFAQLVYVASQNWPEKYIKMRQQHKKDPIIQYQIINKGTNEVLLDTRTDSKEEIIDMAKQFKKDYVKELGPTVDHLQKAGLSKDEVKKILTDRKFSSKVIDSVLDRYY